MSSDPGFSTAESRDIFGPGNRLRSMLAVEAALARAAAEAGLIPAAAGEAVAEACAGESFDAADIFAAGWEAGSPVIPLVAALETAVGKTYAAHVHFGATSQDIIDTGLMLQVRDGLVRLEADVRSLGTELCKLATEHRATARLARTLLQPAGATTLGMTVSGWLDALTRDLGRLQRTRARLALQLGGAVGDRAAFGEHAEAVVAHMATSLGLVATPLPWHTSRDRIGEIASAVSLFCQTSTKIAGDLLLLAQAEVGEVSMRAGRSSAMPDKHNPIDAIRVVAAARFAAGQATLLLAPSAHAHERAAGSWHLEWAAVPHLFHGSLAASEGLVRAFETLEVHPDRMAAHLDHLPKSRKAAPGPETGRLIDRALADWAEVSR